MRNVHYFQRFSQKENVVTNNTLLLFSRLYNYDHDIFQDFLNELLNNIPNIKVGLQFFQQVKNKNSIPDGIINQNSFKIIIETKLYDNYNKQQLNNHLNGFLNEEISILLLINPNSPSNAFKSEMDEYINSFNKTNGRKILFVTSTFEKIISIIRDILSEINYEMIEILDDFENFCSEANLLPINDYLLKAVPCGFSIKDNEKYKIYYDPITRSYTNHKYLGFYNEKSIKFIGEIKNVITANYDYKTQTLTIKDQLKKDLISDDEKKRIINIIEDTNNNLYIDLSNDHKFYIFDEIYFTDYKKKSKYPLQGAKYFNLKEILNPNELVDINAIVNGLKNRSW